MNCKHVPPLTDFSMQVFHQIKMFQRDSISFQDNLFRSAYNVPVGQAQQIEILTRCTHTHRHCKCKSIFLLRHLIATSARYYFCLLCGVFFSTGTTNCIIIQ